MTTTTTTITPTPFQATPPQQISSIVAEYDDSESVYPLRVLKLAMSLTHTAVAKRFEETSQHLQEYTDRKLRELLEYYMKTKLNQLMPIPPPPPPPPPNGLKVLTPNNIPSPLPPLSSSSSSSSSSLQSNNTFKSKLLADSTHHNQDNQINIKQLQLQQQIDVFQLQSINILNQLYTQFHILQFSTNHLCSHCQQVTLVSKGLSWTICCIPHKYSHGENDSNHDNIDRVQTMMHGMCTIFRQWLLLVLTSFSKINNNNNNQPTCNLENPITKSKIVVVDNEIGEVINPINDGIKEMIKEIGTQFISHLGISAESGSVSGTISLLEYWITNLFQPYFMSLVSYIASPKVQLVKYKLTTEYTVIFPLLLLVCTMDDSSSSEHNNDQVNNAISEHPVHRFLFTLLQNQLLDVSALKSQWQVLQQRQKLQSYYEHALNISHAKERFQRIFTQFDVDFQKLFSLEAT
jgi:hypothetical protein